MKKILLVFAMIVCMTTCFVGGAFAQGAQFGNEQQIPWKNYSVSAADAVNQEKGVYLCCMTTQNGVDTYRFVNAGGDNGTLAILGNRGLRFDVESYGNGYRFKSSIKNPNPDNGEYLGTGDWSTSVYLDQTTTWTLSEVTGGEHPVYHIGRLGVDNNGALQNSGQDDWLIIPRESFRTVLLSVTNQTNINVSGLFLNTRFLRNMAVKDSWEWYAWDGSSIGGELDEDAYNVNSYLGTDFIDEDQGVARGLSHGGIESKGAFRGISPYIGNGSFGGILGLGSTLYPYGSDSYVTTYGAFGTAEMRDPIIMRQTYTGLKPGTYVITAQAFVSDDNSDAPITDGSNIAYLFAAGTSGVSDGALIPQLSEGEQESFNGYITKHQGEFNKGENDVDLYFRRNVAAGEFLATNNGTISTSAATYSPDETNHLVTIAVNVTGTGEDDGILTIGVAKNTAQGRVYVDNIKIYYSGNNEFGINAYSKNNTELSPTNLTGIDLSKYEFARVFNLSRDFGATTDENETTDEGETADDVKIKTPVWEALVMPVNLTKTQVRNTFGDDVKLCHLKGLDNGGSRIQFNTVNLSGNGNETAIYAGECYAVKVTDAPTFRRNDPRHEFIVFSVDENINNAQISYPSPVYQFTGVTRMSKVDALIASQNIDEDDVADTQMSYSEGTVTKTYKTADGNLLFTGYFYKPASVAKGNYVLNAGTVYHLTGDWSGLVGTMWTLQEVDEFGTPVTGSKLSIDFGDDHLTGITEISGDGAADVAVEGVYNLNGQKVSDGNSTDNLPKGIYVVNGRKVVVR